MFSNEIIKEASVLNAQLEKGVIMVPAITSFLSKFRNENNSTTRKSKKQLQEEAIAAEIAKMQSRKKPIKR